jgi:hypothetical protein
MLLLFLPLSLNFCDSKDLGPLWILVLLVLVGSHTRFPAVVIDSW